MKALILKGDIVQVSNQPFPVSSELQWIDCPVNCTTEWTYGNSGFLAPVIEEVSPAKQRKKDLKEIGLSDDIENIIDAILMSDILMFDMIGVETREKYAAKKTLKNK